MYLRLDKYSSPEKALVNGEANGGYIRFILWNMTKSFHKSKQKLGKVRIGEGFEIEQVENFDDYGYGKFLKCLDRELETWSDFERTLFRLYIGTYGTQNIKTYGEKIPIRKFVRESTIPQNTIFTTLRKCKQMIKENLAEDWQDYLNDDIELL